MMKSWPSEDYGAAAPNVGASDTAASAVTLSIPQPRIAKPLMWR